MILEYYRSPPPHQGRSYTWITSLGIPWGIVVWEACFQVQNWITPLITFSSDCVFSDPFPSATIHYVSASNQCVPISSSLHRISPFSPSNSCDMNCISSRSRRHKPQPIFHNRCAFSQKQRVRTPYLSSAHNCVRCSPGWYPLLCYKTVTGHTWSGQM